MRTRHFLALVVVAMLVAACRSKPQANPEDPWPGQYLAAHRVVNDGGQTVGYVKTWEYANEGAGEPFRLFHVHNLDFEERGVVTEMGTAKKYVILPPEIARAKGKMIEIEMLPAQPLPYQAAMILDVPSGVKLVRMTPAEFAALAE